MAKQDLNALLAKLNANEELSATPLGASYTYQEFIPKAKEAGFDLDEQVWDELHAYVGSHDMQGWALRSICSYLGL